MPTLLFFYGTLMGDTGTVRSGLLDRGGLGRLVGEGRIRGDLFAVSGGAFPAFMSGDGEIVGQVWEVADEHLVEVLHMTDGIEGYRPGHPEFSMYLREEHALLDDDRTVLCYRWNRPVPGARIESGSWREFVATERPSWSRSFEDERAATATITPWR